jgi:hypothetical protein
LSTTTVDKRLHDLLSRALDPGTPEPEAVTSAAVLIRHARRESLTPIGFAEAIGVERQLPPPPRKEPRACAVRMPVGKHAGETLGEIATEDASYLAWLAKDFRDSFIRNMSREVMEWMEGGAR